MSVMNSGDDAVSRLAQVNENRKALGVEPLTEAELERKLADLRIMISEFLFYKWDPIRLGSLLVSGWGVRDEYRAYEPEVYRLTLENTSPLPLAEYLSWVSDEIIGVGLSGPNRSPEHHKEVAESIFFTFYDVQDDEASIEDESWMEGE